MTHVPHPTKTDMISKTILAFAAAVAFASCGHNDTLVKTTTQSPQTDYAATLIANNIKAMPKGYSISIGIAVIGER